MQGSHCHCLKPYLRNNGKGECCQSRPAWAIPEIGLSTRPMRSLPSAPRVAKRLRAFAINNRSADPRTRKQAMAKDRVSLLACV
eukprot:2282592-Pleurochrysis_carterae.AAC.2